MTHKLVIISGALGAGKSTLARQLRIKYAGDIWALADQLRGELLPLLSDLGIQSVQDMKGRQDIKTDFRPVLQAYGQFRRSLDENYWVKKLCTQLMKEAVESDYLPDFNYIDDVRFANEVESLDRFATESGFDMFWIHLVTDIEDTLEYLQTVRNMSYNSARKVVDDVSEMEARNLSSLQGCYLIDARRQKFVNLDPEMTPDSVTVLVDAHVAYEAQKGIKKWLAWLGEGSE